TLEDKAVTIRERDSLEQVRVPIEELVDELRSRLPV
ncbi:MAG: His/Gly/Thr/Pro-type tRNA ligase C-terminal domain-containing protein, partial [Acidimicrobiales bacterium]